MTAKIRILKVSGHSIGQTTVRVLNVGTSDLETGTLVYRRVRRKVVEDQTVVNGTRLGPGEQTDWVIHAHSTQHERVKFVEYRTARNIFPATGLLERGWLGYKITDPNLF